MAEARTTGRLRLAAVALLAAGLACSSVSDLTGGAATPPPATATVDAGPGAEQPTAAPTLAPATTAAPTQAPAITRAPVAGTVLFEDSFDENRNGWEVDANDSTARSFREGRYFIEVFSTVWFAWATPAVASLNDIHVQVTVSNTGGNDPAFGILCSYLNSGAFYVLGFGDDGYYGIARVDGDDFHLLTGTENRWTLSEDIQPGRAAYELEADCHADGRLRLAVDGVVIAEAQDNDPYGPGSLGLFVQSFDNVPVEVAFDNLVVTQLTAD